MTRTSLNYVKEYFAILVDLQAHILTVHGLGSHMLHNVLRAEWVY